MDKHDSANKKNSIPDDTQPEYPCQEGLRILAHIIVEKHLSTLKNVSGSRSEKQQLDLPEENNNE